MAATILVVDDETEIRRIVSILLKQEGYRALEASNGSEALTVLGQETPDLVLLDIIMPGMDGFEVCQAIRENPRTASVPVIMLSAVSNQVHDSTIKVDDYVPKPFKARDLLSRIEALVG